MSAMFDVPVEKNYNEKTFATAPTASTGSITTNGLNYSKLGVLIHGQYIFTTTVGSAAVTFSIPIKSYYAITVQDSLGTAAPLAFTTSLAGTSGMIQVSVTVTTAGTIDCRFVGSDSKTLTANDPSPSRALKLNRGKQFNPKANMSLNVGNLTGVTGFYQYVKYPIKLLIGSFTTDQAATLTYNLSKKTTVLDSYITSNTTTAIGTLVAGTVTAGCITFAVGAAGTHTFLIMLRERGY